MALGVPNAFANAITLVLSYGGQDGEYELRYAIAAHVAAQVDHVQASASTLELLKDLERIGRRPEHAVELGGDDDVALASYTKQPLALRAAPPYRQQGGAGLCFGAVHRAKAQRCRKAGPPEHHQWHDSASPTEDRRSPAHTRPPCPAGGAGCDSGRAPDNVGEQEWTPVQRQRFLRAVPGVVRRGWAAAGVGLRKAACRRLAEAGCSASEIMSISGHKTLAEVERYTREAEQERLAKNAMARIRK